MRSFKRLLAAGSEALRLFAAELAAKESDQTDPLLGIPVRRSWRPFELQYAGIVIFEEQRTEPIVAFVEEQGGALHSVVMANYGDEQTAMMLVCLPQDLLSLATFRHRFAVHFNPNVAIVADMRFEELAEYGVERPTGTEIILRVRHKCSHDTLEHVAQKAVNAGAVVKSALLVPSGWRTVGLIVLAGPSHPWVRQVLLERLRHSLSVNEVELWTTSLFLQLIEQV